MTVDDFELQLQAERPEIDSEFARRLDDWAAAGFPRGGLRSRGGFAEALGRVRDRLRATPPRRILLPLGAAATLVLVVGVGIKAIDQTGGGDSASSVATTGTATAPERAAHTGSAPPETSTTVTGAGAAPSPATGQATAPEFDLNAPAAASAGSAAEVGPAHRKQAQKVDLSLSTAPTDFRDAADGVLDVVAAHRGFVVSSSVSGGDPGVPGAQPGQADFQLKVPAHELPAALAALSDLGHVVSRTDGTKDITERFTSAKRRIAEYTAARHHLLTQLQNAVTTAEQQSIKARLRIVQAQLDNAQADLAKAQQRVSLVPVSVSIAADSAIGAGDGGGGWGIDDAIGDAGDVLTVMAGVALISLAVLLPLALIGAAAYAFYALIVRRQRERALDA
jgi:Domain of unknown function (DUF4349)